MLDRLPEGHIIKCSHRNCVVAAWWGGHKWGMIVIGFYTSWNPSCTQNLKITPTNCPSFGNIRGSLGIVDSINQHSGASASIAAIKVKCNSVAVHIAARSHYKASFMWVLLKNINPLFYRDKYEIHQTIKDVLKNVLLAFLG